MQLSKLSFERQTKAHEIAEEIQRYIPGMVIGIHIETLILESVVISGRGPGYLFSIRMKVSDYDKAPAKAVVSAFMDKHNDQRKGK